MIAELIKTLGPWGLLVGIMGWMLKVMVADKLTGIQRTLADLVEGQNDHSDRIVRIETVMAINGCGTEQVCGPQKRRNTDG